MKEYLLTNINFRGCRYMYSHVYWVIILPCHSICIFIPHYQIQYNWYQSMELWKFRTNLFKGWPPLYRKGLSPSGAYFLLVYVVLLTWHTFLSGPHVPNSTVLYLQLYLVSDVHITFCAFLTVGVYCIYLLTDNLGWRVISSIITYGLCCQLSHRLFGLDISCSNLAHIFADFTQTYILPSYKIKPSSFITLSE